MTTASSTFCSHQQRYNEEDPAVQARLEQLTTDLRMYHDSVLCQGFWEKQFGADIATGLGGGADNDSMAAALQVDALITHLWWHGV